MSDSSDDDDGVCDNYRIDMTHATFGTCKCGKPKSEHTVTTKAGANAKKIISSLEVKPPAGGVVASRWQRQPQTTLLQKKAAAEESEVSAIRTLLRRMDRIHGLHSRQRPGRLARSFGRSRRQPTRKGRPPPPPRPHLPSGGQRSSARGRPAKLQWRWQSSSEGSGAPRWQRWRTRRCASRRRWRSSRPRNRLRLRRPRGPPPLPRRPWPRTRRRLLRRYWRRPNSPSQHPRSTFATRPARDGPSPPHAGPGVKRDPTPLDLEADWAGVACECGYRG